MEAPAAVPASVLLLHLRQAAGPSPDAQERLAGATRTAAGAWSDDARVVLAAAGGFAIVARGDPALALRAARSVPADGELGMVLHHGTVEASESGDGVRLAGEALATAVAVAGEAASTPLVTTPAFRAALARSRRRSLLAAAGLAGILGAGVVVRLAREALEAARRPAVLLLDIQPGGDVYVDGELKGTSPPLARLAIAPGEHTIEIRSGRHRPVKMEVKLKPGEELQLRHEFAASGGGGRRRRPDLVDRMRDRVRSWLR